METDAARLLDVSRRYGRHWALARVSLTIPTGQAVLLTGPNGAGKTTLLRVLATALKPTFGRLEIFGEPAGPRNSGKCEPCRRIGLVTHASYLYEDLSAEENLSLTSRFAGGFNAERVPEILERVGLHRRRASMVRTFSAGMRRRLCLARLLLREPDLILLDEPFGALDPGGVELAEGLVDELRAAGKTVVLATHDIDRGKNLCDLHLQMANGRVASPLAPVTVSAAT